MKDGIHAEKFLSFGGAKKMLAKASHFHIMNSKML